MHDGGGYALENTKEAGEFGRTRPVASANLVDGPAGARSRSELRSLSKFAWTLTQLLALLLLVDRFQLETQAFFRLTALTVAGFTVHYFLPLRWRLPFFVALSLAGLVLVLGPLQAAWLVVVGLALIGICHLPASLYVRAGLLIAVGVALAFPRWGIGRVPWSAAIWPVLGSMFVFRLIIYLYDLDRKAGPTRLSQSLGYFFLLPNVCFPLFPVVDFQKFCRNYYDDDRHKIYQVGVEWMWRGLVQLVLYRLVYYHFTIDPVAVENVGDLAFYMVSTFLLYVRISGHFHLVVGMLHLFGFNLPETHHRYFLASSFTDFWRRINIYWKDFMMKVVYYPAFFRLRKLGEMRALVLATIVTFVATWFLHLVQWFWIRGSVLVEWHDIGFWAIFALLVLVNSVYEARRVRARTLTKRQRALVESVGVVLRTVGTFTVICVMWSFWTSESASDWWLMVRSAMHLPTWTAGRTAAVLVAVSGGLAIGVYGVWRGWGTGDRANAPRVSPRMVLATSLALSILTLPAPTSSLGQAGDLVASLRSGQLNRRDAEHFQRGYYEQLLDVGRFNDELWRVYQAMPTDFVRSLGKLGLSRVTNDGQEYELVPLREARFLGVTVKTNRWGMADKDYERDPRPGTYRMALVGPSTAMGSGVEQGRSFEAVLEDRLNERVQDRPGSGYEVLNFGVGGYTPLNVLYQLDRQVFPFQPDALLYIGHDSDIERATRQWGKMVRKGLASQEPFLAELAQRSGIAPDTGPTEARRRIKPFADDLLAWVYGQIVKKCHDRQVRPVFVYLETVTEAKETWRAADRARVLAVARASGFTVIDLTGVYAGHDPSTLWLMENDGHPNARGSRLIADRLNAMLRERGQDLGLPD